MPNGINYDLEFENRIKGMQDRQLLEFVARQILEVTGKCKGYDKEIASLKDGSRASSGIMGGLTGACTAIIIAAINYFIRRS